jgi:hypothetical protein
MLLRHARWIVPALSLALVLPLAAVNVTGEPSKTASGAGTITGKVSMEDGSAASDVIVRVMNAPPKGGGKAPKSVEPGAGAPEGGGKPGKEGGKQGKGGREAVAEGKTSADGSFSLNVPAGDYVVAAGKKGVGMARERVTVADGASVSVSLTLKPAPEGGKGGEKGPKSPK